MYVQTTKMSSSEYNIEKHRVNWTKHVSLAEIPTNVQKKTQIEEHIRPTAWLTLTGHLFAFETNHREKKKEGNKFVNDIHSRKF